ESVQQQEQVAEVVRRLVPLEVPLGQALNGDRSFIFSIPDIDCYGAWRSLPTAEGKSAEYVGLHVAPMPRSKAKPSDPVWSYLHPSYPSAELIVQTFQAETTFQPLPEALGRKSLAIHHGGLTTTVACALAGVPQIIVPRYIEQQLNGASVYRLGVAQMLINPTAEHLHPLQAQRQLLLRQAQALANRLSDWNCSRIEQVLESCQQLQVA
ncbi:MAG TPA: nucleotide disphospho-sugar-binding domain-containing protein, partial [Chroococcidiopsis sp.]